VSRPEKLLERLREPGRDAGWAFDELCSLLQRLGFEMRIRGSHHFFRRPDSAGVINLQPRDGQAKPYQVRQALQAIDRLLQEKKP
jgi:hypothetical protein